MVRTGPMPSAVRTVRLPRRTGSALDQQAPHPPLAARPGPALNQHLPITESLSLRNHLKIGCGSGTLASSTGDEEAIRRLTILGEVSSNVASLALLVSPESALHTIEYREHDVAAVVEAPVDVFVAPLADLLQD